MLGLAPPLAPTTPTTRSASWPLPSTRPLARLRDALKREQFVHQRRQSRVAYAVGWSSPPCELLAEEPSLGPPRGQLERMTKATEEVRDLVQTFLLLARAEGRGKLAPHGSLESIADDLVQVWREQVEARGTDPALPQRRRLRRPNNAPLRRAR